MGVGFPGWNPLPAGNSPGIETGNRVVGERDRFLRRRGGTMIGADLQAIRGITNKCRGRNVFRWCVNFFAVIGFLGTVVAPVGLLYRSYQSEGKPPAAHLYVVVQKMGQRWGSVGPLIRKTVMATGLLDGQAIYFAREVSVRLPPWRGQGASPFRTTWRHSYDASGMPKGPTGITAAGGMPKNIEVESTNAAPVSITHVKSFPELVDALRSANPGAELVLAPGRYVLSKPIQLETGQAGKADRPIRIRASEDGPVIIEIRGRGHFKVSSPYLIIDGLILRGLCAQASGAICETAFVVDRGGDGFVLHNAFLSGFDQVVKFDPLGSPRTAGMLRGITIIGGQLGLAGSVWVSSDNKVVDLAGAEFRRVCPKGKKIAGCDYPGLDAAFKKTKDDTVFLLYSGLYREATQIKSNNIRIYGEPGIHLEGVAVGGKGAIVVNGADTLIDGIECSRIKVRDGNGSCVRLQGRNLRLVGVHFHDSQEGILTGSDTGKIVVLDSKFKNNGKNQRLGRSHNLYIGTADEFQFIRSLSLTARGQGHEVKSRAKRSIIKDSVIASFNADDSYLIDFPNGGDNLVQASILSEGPKSKNSNAISVGLETKKDKLTWERNNTVFRDNLIILENWKSNGGILFLSRNVARPVFKNNVIVGAGGRKAEGRNHLFDNRQELGLPAYPSIGFD